jgi:chemotaxis methyl-accepting protein methylase
MSPDSPPAPEWCHAQFDSGAELKAFLRICELVLARTGLNLSRYRPATMRRRIENRMSSVGAGTLEQYLNLLERSRGEELRLLERLTIKVSRFYRDHAGFEALRYRLLPRLAAAGEGRSLRIWCAGCGFGEEPYTLAMLLEEAAAAGEVIATDVDPAALAAACEAVYDRQAVQSVPQRLAELYLHRYAIGGRERYRVRHAAARRVRFVRHDVTSGTPPIPEARFDLVCCRNVLIYLRPEEQARTFVALRNALADTGFLWLGEAEWPPAAVAGQFEPYDSAARIFRAAVPLRESAL